MLGDLDAADWSRPTLSEARERAERLTGLNAFVTMTGEQGDGPVVAVKDLVDVQGTPTTGGGAILPLEPVARDAKVVERLRMFGCVVIGKTNLHEWAFGTTSLNRHFGDVRNPADPTRVAGGSSGGSAVAVASGMCAWAIGTDTAGSIRIPSSLCGVVGIKPSAGLVSTEGVIPLAPSLDTVGPLAPTVASAARALELMSGTNLGWNDPPSDKPRLAVPAEWVSDLDEPTADAWSAFRRGLPDILFPGRERVTKPATAVLLHEAAAFHQHWMRDHAETYAPDVLAKLRTGLEIDEDRYRLAHAELESVREEVDEAMRDCDALVLPATARVAPLLAGADDAREPLSRFARPFNATGQPVITLPLPVDGLPVGVQLIGRVGEDAALIAVARAVERRLAVAARESGGAA